MVIMEKKLGYKQTEVGVIPEDWNTEILESVCVPEGLIRGPFGGSLKKAFFVRDGFKVYEQKNAIYQDANLGSYFISEDKYKELKRFEIKEGDFIISCSGTIGKIFQIPKNAKAGVINQALLKMKIDSRVIHEQFFFYAFGWDKFQQKIIDNTQGGAMQNLVGMDIFRNIAVPLPPLPEQRAIATALSDVDALLTSLDKLIAKKRDIKQATMQQLLTGKTRLAGFSDNESAKLGDFFELNPTKTHLNNTDLVTFIRMEDISESGRIINQHILPLSSIKKGFTFFERNDVLVAKITPCFENGKGGCLDTLKTKSGFGSTEFHVLRAKKNAIPRYVFYQTQTAEFRQQLEAEMIGTAGQKRVPAQAIINYSLPVLHLIDEQRAIAAILSDMDAEIATLEQRRDKTRALKQGMMQELLTGKTRLMTP